MSENTALFFKGYGQIISDVSYDELEHILESAQFETKMMESCEEENEIFIRALYLDGEEITEIVFEKIEQDEYIFQIEAKTEEKLEKLSAFCSNVLAEYQIEHRIELFDKEDQPLGYCHFNWEKED